MNAVTHLEKVITGEVSAVTHLEKVIAGETSAVTYTEKVITGEAPPITHLQKVIAGEASPVTHLEYVWAGGSPTPTEHEYTGAVPYTFTANGSPLISWRISGNTVQTGTPTPTNPIQPSECGDLETSGAKAGQYKIPISSANTKTHVYLGEVQTTRKIKKLVLKGSVDENITLYTIATGNLFRIELPSLRLLAQFANNGFCTHYRSVYRSADRVNGTISGGNVAAVQGFVDIVDNYATVEDFKTYLAAQYAAGTPVVVWYVLATETTGIVNEPIRKIGDYADTLSMEQAGVSIPTNNGSTTVDVETTLKPSEVYIKYKGV